MAAKPIRKAAAGKGKPKPPTASENVAAYIALMRERAELRRKCFPKNAKEFLGTRNRATEEAFLDGLREGWSITASAKAAGISRVTPFNWRKASMETLQEDGTYLDDFCVRWLDAIDAGADLLEDEAKRRGVDGVDKPVYQGGALVGTITEYSDTLLINLLRGKRPSTYNTGRMEHSGKDGGKILHSLEVEFIESNGEK